MIGGENGAGAGPDNDAGEPIRELADLRQAPSSRFLPRLRNSIHRRSLASQVISLSWSLPVLLVREILEFLFQSYGRDDVRKGGRGE